MSTTTSSFDSMLPDIDPTPPSVNEYENKQHFQQLLHEKEHALYMALQVVQQLRSALDYVQQQNQCEHLSLYTRCVELEHEFKVHWQRTIQQLAMLQTDQCTMNGNEFLQEKNLIAEQQQLIQVLRRQKYKLLEELQQLMHEKDARLHALQANVLKNRHGFQGTLMHLRQQLSLQQQLLKEKELHIKQLEKQQPESVNAEIREMKQLRKELWRLESSVEECIKSETKMEAQQKTVKDLSVETLELSRLNMEYGNLCKLYEKIYFCKEEKNKKKIADLHAHLKEYGEAMGSVLERLTKFENAKKTTESPEVRTLENSKESSPDNEYHGDENEMSKQSKLDVSKVTAGQEEVDNTLQLNSESVEENTVARESEKMANQLFQIKEVEEEINEESEKMKGNVKNRQTREDRLKMQRELFGFEESDEDIENENNVMIEDILENLETNVFKGKTESEFMQKNNLFKLETIPDEELVHANLFQIDETDEEECEHENSAIVEDVLKIVEKSVFKKEEKKETPRKNPFIEGIRRKVDEKSQVNTKLNNNKSEKVELKEMTDSETENSEKKSKHSFNLNESENTDEEIETDIEEELEDDDISKMEFSKVEDTSKGEASEELQLSLQNKSLEQNDMKSLSEFSKGEKDNREKEKTPLILKEQSKITKIDKEESSKKQDKSKSLKSSEILREEAEIDAKVIEDISNEETSRISKESDEILGRKESIESEDRSLEEEIVKISRKEVSENRIENNNINVNEKIEEHKIEKGVVKNKIDKNANNIKMKSENEEAEDLKNLKKESDVESEDTSEDENENLKKEKKINEDHNEKITEICKYKTSRGQVLDEKILVAEKEVKTDNEAILEKFEKKESVSKHLEEVKEVLENDKKILHENFAAKESFEIIKKQEMTVEIKRDLEMELKKKRENIRRIARANVLKAAKLLKIEREKAKEMESLKTENKYNIGNQVLEEVPKLMDEEKTNQNEKMQLLQQVQADFQSLQQQLSTTQNLAERQNEQLKQSRSELEQLNELFLKQNQLLQATHEQLMSSEEKQQQIIEEVQTLRAHFQQNDAATILEQQKQVYELKLQLQKLQQEREAQISQMQQLERELGKHKRRGLVLDESTGVSESSRNLATPLDAQITDRLRILSKVLDAEQKRKMQHYDLHIRSLLSNIKSLKKSLRLAEKRAAAQQQTVDHGAHLKHLQQELDEIKRKYTESQELIKKLKSKKKSSTSIEETLPTDKSITVASSLGSAGETSNLNDSNKKSINNSTEAPKMMSQENIMELIERSDNCVPNLDKLRAQLEGLQKDIQRCFAPKARFHRGPTLAEELRAAGEQTHSSPF